MANPIDQTDRLWFRVGAELFAKQVRDKVSMTDRGVPPAVARQNLKQQTLRTLAQWIERDQPLCGPDRLRPVAGLVVADRTVFEDMRDDDRHARPFGGEPFVEPFDIEVEPVEKRSHAKIRSLLQHRDIGRLCKYKKFTCVDAHQRGIESDSVTVDQQGLCSDVMQVLAQCQQALPKTLPRLSIRAVPPEDGGDPFTGIGVTRLHCQIGEQGAMARRGNVKEARRIPLDAGGKAAEQRNSQTFRHAAIASLARHLDWRKTTATGERLSFRQTPRRAPDLAAGQK